jgi:SpoVK/Ycf46/Vps4 family AAA+-type ATPase
VSSSVHACAPNQNAIADRSWRLGPDVLVHAKGILLRHAIDTVFSNLGCEDPTAIPTKTSLVFELRRIDKSRLRLFANGLPIVTLSDEGELAPALEGTLIGCAVRKRLESAALHAGTVELGGQGVLISGAKGAGKSTLTLTLANEGARYLGDEIAFVRYDDVSC